MLKRISRLSAIFIILMVGEAYAVSMLPVYIEDNHAGSFYFLSETLDWNKKYTLLLFDAHSDSSAVMDSDHIREKLAEHYTSDKSEFYNDWNQRSIIQCFNWIEPLMPRPVNNVIWIPSDSISNNQRLDKYKEIKHEINGFTEMDKRKCGDLFPRFSVKGFNEQLMNHRFKNPVIASIDLDYFTNYSPEQAEKKFEKILDYLLSIGNLECITLSISRPYLKSARQTDSLLYIAFKNISGIVNSRITFEPFISHGFDRSKRARSYYKKIWRFRAIILRMLQHQ